jgi:hypothetical protein
MEMSEKEYQDAYRKLLIEIDDIAHARKQEKKKLKNLEENSEIASMLHRDTMYLLEELNAQWKGTRSAAFLQEQADLIQGDFRTAENNRLAAYEQTQEKLKALKKQEMQWEEKQKKQKQEKEKEQNGTNTEC